MEHVTPRHRHHNLLLAAASLAIVPWMHGQDQGTPATDRVREAGHVIGLEFTDSELALMRKTVGNNLRKFTRLRRHTLPNDVYPALRFDPFQPGIERRTDQPPVKKLTLPEVQRPDDLEELFFADIPTLASLIKTRKVSCVELAELFLARLAEVDKKLFCVITLTRERALDTATRLDQELAQGRWRGLLHGIPYGAKDLLAAKGYKTTWGAKPFRDQMLDYDATVVTKLEKAGAVLVAKLTLGALAWGDVWFAAQTRNPWNPARGSSGSSAGSAAATAAGAVPFAIGSETLGSIVSPSRVCGCSSLRPTFGRVSRTGAMALSWSMDKLGPLCRSALDAAIVFEKIQGPDGKDPSVFDLPFAVPVGVDVRGMRVGVPKGAFRRDGEVYREIRRELEALGVEITEVELPRYPTRDMTLVLNAEAAAAFDELTRSDKDDELVRQVEQAWPNVFRASRLIPAVEYIQANRLRVQLMRDWDAMMRQVDVLVHPPYAAGILQATNLTGHPTFTAPFRTRRGGGPGTICFTGQLAGEARLLALVIAWQKATAWHKRHPEI